ncbi:PQQ-binding-like beta-propeller repeat protein [Paenibacillus sp. GP183]
MVSFVLVYHVPCCTTGVRGFVSAYDAETGSKLWQFYKT